LELRRRVDPALFAMVMDAVLHGVSTRFLPALPVPELLQAFPPILAPERVAWLAERARVRFRPAA
jgi:hypothetical protein